MFRFLFQRPASRNSRVVTGTAILAAIGCFVAVWSVSSRHLPEVFTRRTDRVMLWTGTCRMIRVAPLTGWGVARFASEYPPFAPPAFALRMKDDNTFAEHPHSEYLHVAVETGVLGLGIFLWLLASIKESALARIKRGDPLAAAALGSVTAILVHISVDRNFRLASTGIPFWILAGILTRPMDAGERTDGARAPRMTWLIAVPALALGAFLLRPLLASYRVAGDPDFLKQAAEFSAAQLEAERSTRGSDPQYFLALGNSYAKEGTFPKAVQAFAEALRLDPRSTAAANNLGNSWFMMSRFDEAIAAYRKVLALDSGNRDARFNLAFALFHQRKIKEALAECDALLRLDPQNAKALQLRARLAP